MRTQSPTLGAQTLRPSGHLAAMRQEGCRSAEQLQQEAEQAAALYAELAAQRGGGAVGPWSDRRKRGGADAGANAVERLSAHMWWSRPPKPGIPLSIQHCSACVAT